MVPLALACTFFVLSIICSGVLAWFVVRRYSDPKRSERLSSVTAGLVLALTFCSLTLIPFDVYSVSAAPWEHPTVSSVSSSSDSLSLVDALAPNSNSSDAQFTEKSEPGVIIFVEVFSYSQFLFPILIHTHTSIVSVVFSLCILCVHSSEHSYRSDVFCACSVCVLLL